MLFNTCPECENVLLKRNYSLKLEKTSKNTKGDEYVASASVICLKFVPDVIASFLKDEIVTIICDEINERKQSYYIVLTTALAKNLVDILFDRDQYEYRSLCVHYYIQKMRQMFDFVKGKVESALAFIQGGHHEKRHPINLLVNVPSLFIDIECGDDKEGEDGVFSIGRYYILSESRRHLDTPLESSSCSDGDSSEQRKYSPEKRESFLDDFLSHGTEGLTIMIDNNAPLIDSKTFNQYFKQFIQNKEYKKYSKGRYMCVQLKDKKLFQKHGFDIDIVKKCKRCGSETRCHCEKVAKKELVIKHMKIVIANAPDVVEKKKRKRRSTKSTETRKKRKVDSSPSFKEGEEEEEYLERKVNDFFGTSFNKVPDDLKEEEKKEEEEEEELDFFKTGSSKRRWLCKGCGVSFDSKHELSVHYESFECKHYQ